MAFQLPDESFKLVIDDGVYNGVEAKVGGLTAGSMIDLTSLAEVADQAGPEQAAAVGDLMGMFAESLTWWNVERDGTPVPATLEGIRSTPFALVMELIDLWVTAGGGVDGPLESRSPDGGQPVEATIPMEPLSPSPRHLQGLT